MDNKILVTRSSMPSMEEYIEEIRSIWDSHWLTNMGEKHKALQAELQKYMGVPAVELLTNGHMALELSLQAMNLQGEVITTPFTFASTTHAIVRNGLEPVFCDIDPETYTMDVTQIERLITDRTCAILPVHVYGNVCNIEEIERIAHKYGLKVLYDAAHTFGETYKGQGIGNFGDASCFSFHATKVFNTIDFAKSMHYNPFAYISKKNREKDILKFVEVLIKNTSSSQQPSGDDFWVKAEKLLYTAYIALIFAMYPEDEWNFETLIDMINNSECREDDEEFKNSIDLEFEIVECWLNGTKHDDPDVMEDYADLFETKPDAEQRRMGAFALKQFKAYKLAAGKTAKSILISCSTRLAPFAIDEVLEITSYDELHLDKLGDELSALFIIISDTDATFNFLVAIMYSQLFNLLCTKADNSPGGKLDYHVRCLLDEFANIGEIPQFEKLIATIRSREISASIILQAKSQLKAIYKDNADTIEGNCDTMLFLGGKEKSTLKEISESLGKETIDSFNTSTNRGQSESYGMNYQKLGKELKSQDELAVMDGGKCILQVRGVRPFFSDKYDITRHKQYPMLLDDNPEMGFNIEKYVSDQKAMRLRLSRQVKFTGYGVDMTAAGQEVTTVSATETETADTQNSEGTDEKEIYVGF